MTQKRCSRDMCFRQTQKQDDVASATFQGVNAYSWWNTRQDQTVRQSEHNSYNDVTAGRLIM